MTKNYPHIYTDEFIDNLKKENQLIEIDDIVKAVEFLLDSTHINGEIIKVDGGMI